MGSDALKYNVNGGFNTAMGQGAGGFVPNVWYSTFLGNRSYAILEDTIENVTALGNNTTILASNQVRIGNVYVNSIGGYRSWSNLSDGRYKKDIQADVPGMDFIRRLRPVTYRLEVEKLNQYLQPSSDRALNDQESQFVPREDSGVHDRVFTGFLAREVENAAKAIQYEFSGIDSPQNENDLYGLRYAEFVVPLVKAVQEQDDQIGILKQKLARSEDRIKELENKLREMDDIIERLEKLEGSDREGELKGRDLPALEQNQPNPFGNGTVIKYYLPKVYSDANLVIYSASGQMVKSFSLTDDGHHQIDLTTANFPAGTYAYALLIDGKVVATRKMTRMQ